MTERNSSCERAHFKKKKKMCCDCCNPWHHYWIEMKWQSWHSVVSDGAKTFLKLFSLRGGGLNLPHGFRFSPFPLNYSAHDDVHILYIWLWWFLKWPFLKGAPLSIDIHFTNWLLKMLSISLSLFSSYNPFKLTHQCIFTFQWLTITFVMECVLYKV